MKLPTAEHFGLTEDKEKRLSEIIDEINSRTGKSYDNDVVVKAMLQIRDILMKSEKLKTSAKNNTQQDFEFSYFDDIDDALIEGLSQNQDFLLPAAVQRRDEASGVGYLCGRDLQEPAQTRIDGGDRSMFDAIPIERGAGQLQA